MKLAGSFLIFLSILSAIATVYILWTNDTVGSMDKFKLIGGSFYLFALGFVIFDHNPE